MPKLMLVEDDNNLREIYEARLQAEGYEIVSAKDGEEALVVAKAEKPDLIISDIMMPKISGFEMLDILRNTDGLKQVKIIMLTALGQNDDQQLANRLGADRYLVKSQVTLEDIVKAAHELLGDSSDSKPPAASPVATPTPVAAAAPANPAVPSQTTAETAPTPVAAIPVTTPPPESSATATPTIPVATEPLMGNDTAPPSPVSASQLSSSPAAPITTAPPPDWASASQSSQQPPAAAGTAAPPASSPSGAQSTAQEEASVEGKIEDFVAGATDQATAPTPDPAVDNAAASSPEPGSLIKSTTAAASPATAADDAAANHDKLVEDAAQSLLDSTKQAAESATDDTAKPTNSGGPVSRRGKKVIAPLDNKDKKDLDELLAMEEVKEAAKAGPVAPKPIIVADDPHNQSAAAPPNPVIEPVGMADSSQPAAIGPALSQPNNPADPNSIAL